MMNKNGINPERLHYLVQQYIANTCTKKELDELLLLIKDGRNQASLERELKENWHNSQTGISNDTTNWDERFFSMMKEAKTESQIARVPVKHRRFYRMAAASVIIILAAGYFWFKYYHSNSNKALAQNNIVQRYKNDVPPGGNKAVLTLANGSKIILDSAHNGMLSQQGATKIIKINSGQLAFEAKGLKPKAKSGISFNTLTTPRGGQYQITLPDGSKVWLNAASSLRFPTAFTGKERRVELTGEAYFEVKPLSPKGENKVPFIVHVHSSAKNDGLDIKVLGTHFNIMAYNDEANTTTTLLQGSVKIISEKADALLKPGQQAILKKGLSEIKVSNADIEEAIAWKNGYLQFNNSSLETILRQISRWYDVDVSYSNNNPPQRFFTGKISRNVSLANMLKVLELSDVHFKIEGRKLIVIS